MIFKQNEKDLRKIQERCMYRTRRYSQLAEKLGWNIAGYSLAYGVFGNIGIFALGLAMISSASISTGILYHFRIELRPRLIRLALALRGGSFTMMLLGGHLGNLWIFVLGGAASGVFVGLFWPTYYRIQNIWELDFSEWNARDKLAGAFIVLIAGFSVDLFGVQTVLLISLTSILVSALFSRDLILNPNYLWGGGNKLAPRSPLGLLLSNHCLIATSEGALNAMANLSRIFVVLAGLIELSGLSGSASLGILLAITGAFGAGTTWAVERLAGERRSVRPCLMAFGMTITFISSLMIAREDTWIIGMIILSTGTSVIFPVLKKEVDEKLHSSGSGNHGLREYSRNIGRLLGYLIIAVIGYSYPELSMLAVPVSASILFIALLYVFSMDNGFIRLHGESRSIMKREVRK